MSLKTKLAKLEAALTKRPARPDCCKWIAIVNDPSEITEAFLRCPICGRLREGPVLIVDDLLDDGPF